MGFTAFLRIRDNKEVCQVLRYGCSGHDLGCVRVAPCVETHSWLHTIPTLWERHIIKWVAIRVALVIWTASLLSPANVDVCFTAISTMSSHVIKMCNIC